MQSCHILLSFGFKALGPETNGSVGVVNATLCVAGRRMRPLYESPQYILSMGEYSEAGHLLSDGSSRRAMCGKMSRRFLQALKL